MVAGLVFVAFNIFAAVGCWTPNRCANSTPVMPRSPMIRRTFSPMVAI
jgi:hypothetical protein